MKVAVITEGSTKHRNADVVAAAESLGLEVLNLGMKNEPDEPDLSYLETAFLSALVLNLKVVDFVLGGCGTGQGYMNAILQFPGTACGLLLDPVDAFLFSQVNAGNCISFALNKGYGGVGGDINLKYMLKELFAHPYGQGYPEARREIQVAARRRLEKLSALSHRSMEVILDVMDPIVLHTALDFPGIRACVEAAPESSLKRKVLEIYAHA